MKKITSLFLLVVFLTSDVLSLSFNSYRRIKDISQPTISNFRPLIDLLRNYWGDSFERNVNFLLDVYTVWKHKENDELIKTKLTELRQFHPILYPWIIGIRASLKWMNEGQQEEIIKDQLWQAVPQPARRNLENLLEKENRTEQEKAFITWLNQNKYSLQEALIRFISGIYKSLTDNPEVKILDFQIQISP